jgi:hypothetical protein
MRTISKYALTTAITLFAATTETQASNPAQWTIVQQILRTDTSKSWTSPTTVDLGKMVWLYDFEITKMTGTVNVPILGDVTQDITISIPPGMHTGGGESSNLPAVVLSTDFTHADSGSSAHLFIEIDSLGYGHGEFSNIVLGSINVPFFGNRPIQRLNMEGNVTVIGYDFGDFNRDGAVNGADYTTWRKSDGSPADYDLWRSHYGASSGTSLQQERPVPEPTCVVMLSLGIAVGVVGGRQKRIFRKRPSG